MREIRTEIQLAAPVEKVWQVLTDFDGWKDWNPTVKGVMGKANVGTTLDITMTTGDCKEMSYKAQVEEADAPNVFRWRAKMMGGLMFTNDRIFILREKDGGTQFVHSEKYGGLMILMTWGKMKNFVPKILEKMNQALKEKVEG